MTRQAKVLSRRTKFPYGAGDTGFSLTTTIIGADFLIFLTDVVGVPPGVAAVSIFVGKSYDYVNLPVIWIAVDVPQTTLHFFIKYVPQREPESDLIMASIFVTAILALLLCNWDIRIAFGPLPAILLYLGILFAILYPLGRDEYARIAQDLAERRAAGSEEAA
jgi:Na+/melibiose symporter-like transporter